MSIQFFIQKKIHIYIFFCLAVYSINSFGQFGKLPPFSIEIEAIKEAQLPGLHSFAFASSGSKWLFVGGRTNGLHGLNSNDGFPVEHSNNNVIVIDTSNWNFYYSSLNILPHNLADPMRSTNMQYIQEGNYLYMIGGFGWDSTNARYTTFPTLTAIHVDNMINAVINTKNISSSIRQITDTNFAVCGGELAKMGNNYYLVFGHDFKGRYADPPVPIFTQKYTDKIKKFDLTDNGTQVTLSPFTYDVDTNNFHRRDLNLGPVIKPDGTFAYRAYGGVFKKDKNLPFLEPITISPSGNTIHNNYQQVMSHYTCGMLPIFDSVTKAMYTVFFGGTSLYDYKKTTNQVVLDTLVPFINDVTTMSYYANNTIEETVLPTQLPGLLGTNAKFILNTQLPHYKNEVLNLQKLPSKRILAGYLFGGIRAKVPNLGVTSANDTIYRVYITPNITNDLKTNETVEINTILYPNPSNSNSVLFFRLEHADDITITLYSITGSLVKNLYHKNTTAGNHQLNIDLTDLDNGIYYCKLISKQYGSKILKLIKR